MSLSRKRSYTAEEAAELIMAEDDPNLVDSDDSIESTSDEEESSELSEAETNETDIEMMAVSPIPCFRVYDGESDQSASFMNSTHISTFSGDSAIPADAIIVDCPAPVAATTNTTTAPQEKSMHIMSFLGTGNNVNNVGKKQKENMPIYNWAVKEPVIPEFEFNERVGLTIEMPPDATPIDYLQLQLTDELISEVRIATNLYANCVIDSSGPLSRRSIWKKWKPVTDDEMRKFLALVFHMGLIKMPSYKHYWKIDKLFRSSIFSSVMSRERFQLIMRFLHFGNNPDFVGDRLGKVRLLIHHLNDTMAELYVPGKDLSVDESMMLFRGRLVFRQYIKNKRHKYGVKYYELCTSDGLILKISIYAAQAEIATNTTVSLGKTAEVVLNLMENFLFKGYHLFADNYYNSVALTRHFTNQRTYITGTLRKDRVDNPKSVIQKKLKKGEMSWMCDNEVTVTKWKDKREVLTISNAHKPEMVVVSNKNGKMKKKPNIVRDYNDGMSGVDRSDQMLSYNTALKKSLRWNKKVGIHIMEMLLHNAHYLFRKSTKTKMSITDFKEHAIRWLIGDIQQPRCIQPVANFHYLFPIPATGKKNNPTRKCVVCATAGKRRESRYICAYCEDQIPLCIYPCFVQYHSNLGITRNICYDQQVPL